MKKVKKSGSLPRWKHGRMQGTELTASSMVSSHISRNRTPASKCLPRLLPSRCYYPPKKCRTSLFRLKLSLPVEYALRHTLHLPPLPQLLSTGVKMLLFYLRLRQHCHLAIYPHYVHRHPQVHRSPACRNAPVVADHAHHVILLGHSKLKSLRSIIIVIVVALVIIGIINIPLRHHSHPTKLKIYKPVHHLHYIGILILVLEHLVVS
jgi:hypothetical protein